MPRQRLRGPVVHTRDVLCTAACPAIAYRSVRPLLFILNYTPDDDRLKQNAIRTQRVFT